MTPRRPTFDPKGTPLSRKRTADLLNVLRRSKHQARMLKASIETQEAKEPQSRRPKKL